MNRKYFLIALVIVAVVAAAGWLAWQNRPLPDDVAAKVDEVVFPMASMKVLWRAAKRDKPDVTLEQVARGAIENHLLATRMQVHGGAEHEERGSDTVGYDRATRREHELFRVLRSAFAEPIRHSLERADAGSPMAFLTDELMLDADILAPALAAEQALYHRMTEAQRREAADIVLGHYRFPGGEKRPITLLDIYKRQNIQLKVQRHNMNLEFLREAVEQYLATEYVLHWFRHDSGLDDREIAAVERMVGERLEKEARLHRIGLMADIHDDNEALKAVAANVSDDEIRAFYQENREAFTRVERVRARHIRLSGQSQADAVYKKLQQGMAFEDAVQRFSTAPDKTAERPGDLGWISRDDRHDNWLRGIAFVQPEGKFSPPFRSPGREGEEGYWEIIHVDEKEIGYQPADSEGVRHEASRAIARDKLRQRYRDLLERLRAGADIRINKSVVAP